MTTSVSPLPGISLAPNFSLREGQAVFLQKLSRAFERGERSHLGVFVPGYGKTLTALASFLVARAQGVCDRLVVFVPRGNLRDQYADAEELAQMLRWLGGPPLPFCVADRSEVFVKNPDIPILVATYQYACGQTGNRALKRYCKAGRPLFVLDEIHHLPEEGAWSDAVAQLPHTALVGLSGTPLRADGKPLFGVPHEVVQHDDGTKEHLYEALHEVSLRDAHAEGEILKRIEAHVVDYEITMVEEDSGRQVQCTLAELKDEITREDVDIDRYFARRHLRFHDVYLETLLGPAIARLQSKRAQHKGAHGRDVRNHQLLVICMSNRHAADVLDFIERRYSWFSATRIGQDVPEQAREDRLEAYRSGAVDIMVQVDMIGEGTDIKTISVIAKLDLVAARSKCLQQIFRGMRYFAPWSEEANVCDVFASGDLGVSDTLDWMTREVQAGMGARVSDQERTSPEKATEPTERSSWSMTQVSERQVETHRLELEHTGRMRVRRGTYEHSSPEAMDMKAQEERLRKECAELATELAYTLQDRGQRIHIRDIHARAKQRFGKAQAGMSLRLLQQKKRWLKRCAQLKRLV